ncbi:MAG TPA: glycosyltransferase family 2 protein, partial [Desulfobacterales bacterium]|nr:glycosyltransferase family 2 protein [Desulfobacterales bacterium]
MISIIIPAKNEASTICDVISSIYDCNIKNYEIILVDGHSTDGTVDKVKNTFDRVKIVLQEDEGKGNGMRLGSEQAKGNILIFIDADGSHDASDIIKLCQPIQDDEADMVVGSRGRG